MADIRLAKPAAGTTQTVPSAPDGRFIFDFPADAATLTRNGDDLVLTFEDGAAIQLQGFYTTYSKEEMPSFQVDGVEISGQDFFAALDEDLMPAAGPASGSSAARGGRYNEYGGSDLLDGLDHLGRLDIGFDGGTQLATDTVEPSPYSEVDHGVTVTPSTPGTDPDDPSIPVQGEDFPPTMPHDVLQVDESALDGGSGGGSATAAGSMRVSAPDGVAIITIGGVVVWQNGALTGNPVLTDEGHLDVTGFDGTNLTYTYTLTGSTQEHTKLNAGGENDAIAHEMAVVVTDTDGDSGSAVIRVEITDDVPTIESFEKTVTEGDADPIVGNALEGAVAGADGANFAWTNPDQQGRYGKLTLNEDGTYSYELNNDDPEVKALTDGDTRTEEISYAYTDADGDVATGKVTITINGVNNGVEVGSGTLTVYEAGLDDGSTPGGGNTPTMASGSLHINAPDGVATIAIGEVTVFKNGALTGNTVSTDEGTLTVTGFDAATGELTFTYTLNDNTLGHGLDGMDTHVSHDFAVTVTDVDGSTASSTITVNIVDDEPTAKNDSVLFEEAAAQKGVSGESVLENDVFGADAPASKTVTSVNDHKPGETVSGTYGELTLHADGTYTYKLGDEVDVPNGKIYTENFTYTITDADGDTSTATLTIAIEGDKIVPANPGNATIVVDEALLPGGNVVNSDNFDHVSLGNGSFTVNLNGEDGTITLKYGTGENSSITLSLINGDPFDETWLSTNTTLTVNGVEVTVTGATQQDNGSWKIEYKYSLTGQQTHTGKGVGEDDALSDDIDITVTDATGDTSTGSLTVTVHDDGPVLNAKIDFQPKNEEGFHYDTDNTIVFNLADSSGEKALQDINFGADVGTGEEGSAPASITVTVNGTEFTVEVTRDEAGNLKFSNEVDGIIEFTTTADDGSKLTYDTAEGQFTYTRPTADVGGTANEYTFILTVTDADGDTVQQTGSVVTVFKEPTITGDDGSTSSTVTTDEGNLAAGSNREIAATEDYGTTAQGSLTVNLDHADGTIQIGENLTIGVDKDGKVVSVNGNPAASLDGKTVPGDHGYLSNITVSEADENGNITIHYTYTLTDAVDGDGASDNRPADGEDGRGESMQADNFTVTVTANGQTATGSIMANALDDAPTISVSEDASGAYGKDITGSVNIDFGADGADGEKSVTVSLNDETVTGVKKDGNYTFTFDDDSTLTLDGSTGNFSYDGVPASGTGTSYTFTFTVTDADGDTDTATTMVTITATDTTQLSGSVTSSDKDVAANTDGDTDNNRAHVVEVEGLPSGAQLAEGFYNGTYGTITVDASGNATYAQTGLFTHSGNGADTQSNADNVTVTVTLDDGSSVDMPVNVSIEDDVPTLTVKEPSVEDQKLPEDNLGSGKDVDFVFEDTATNTEKAGNEVQEDILSQNNTAWENVTIYAAHVNYEKLNDDGYAIDDDGIQNKNNYHLEYSSYPNEGKNPADFGLMVRNEGMDFPQSQDGANGFETNAFVDANGNLTGSEAIVIDLGDKTAYGVSLDFGAFYSNFKGNEGQEHVLITFYKDDEPIGSRVIDAIQNEGGQAVVVHSDQFLSAGFDKVVISALQNTGGTGQASTFTLQGVGLITAPEPIRQVTGEITVASGADGYHAETGEDGTTTSNDFTQAHVRFDMPETLTIETEDGPVSVRLEVKTDSAGNSLLTGSNNGTEYFSVMLEQQRDGSWSWKMEQYQEFLVQGKDGQLGDLELGFITMDGDDDTATETVNIPLKNLPDLAVSQTTLVTDESYIDGLGSETGDDGQANSAKASGTMSVNTYGKEGKLILTIDGEEHQFSLDTGGKLFENQGLTVPTTYGQLTLQNDEAPGTIIYTYTQTKHYNHLSEDGPDQLAENAESFTVKVVDGGGNESGSATITVSIEDDAPVVTVNGDVPASLELTESTETALQTFNASTLFDIKFGADTEGSSTKYELTYREDANSGLKAIVDGKEYDVTLQLEGGILKGTAGGTNIFTVSVAEDTGEVTLAMTGHGTLRHDKTAADDELHLKGVGVKVTVTDGDDDSTTSDSADLTLTITDDVPTISESQKAAIIPSSEEDEDIADFDFNNATKANNAEWVPGWVEGQLPESGNGQVYDHKHEYWGNIEDGYKELALNQGNHTITFSAAVVQYQGSDGNPIEHGDQDDDAPSIKITDITDNITSNEAPLLTFVSTAWNQGESGMAVYSGQRGPWGDQSDGEIGAINGKFNEGNTEWEAVKMDLGEDEAYSITIRLNSFYNTPGDQEKAYIILMNDDKVVDKLLIEGKDAEDGIVDSTKLSSAEAFNTVYIVPWGTKSDFLLNGVEVGYSPVTVLKSEGRVEAGSADGIKGYSFGYDQNDVVTVNEKNLTVSVEDDGKTIHFLSSSSDDDTYTKVIVGEATITEVGKWTLNWFDQETNPQQDTDFTLPIIATDGDDDTAEIKVVPSEDEVGDSQAADALPEEEEKQPAAEKREGKDGPQGMMDGALLQSSMAAEAAAPRMAAATLLGMALVADAADDVLAAATGTDGMPHADVKADGLSGDIGDAPSTLHMDGAAQSGADAFDATLDSSLFAPGVMDPLADGTESLEGLLPDKEHAPFDAEGLLFTAAAPDLSDDASGLVGKGVASGDVLPPAGEEGILGTEETDVLHGTDADDILRGGDGDELIFGGSGDDYIDGGEGRDTIYAGDGNDIIVYDKADYLVSGGSGIDFMVSDDSNLTLETLLKGGTDDNEGPIVNSIEVLLKGNDALSLTSLDQLARDYGITLDSKDGKEVLQLDGRWEKQDDGSYDFNGGAEEGGLTLETNLQHDSDASSDNGEMAQQVFILEHTNS